MLEVIFLNETTIDFFDAVLYYEDQACGLGSDFSDEVESAAKEIADHPFAWPERTDGSHRHLLRRFPYALVYTVYQDEVWIVAVQHCKSNRSIEGRLSRFSL